MKTTVCFVTLCLLAASAFGQKVALTFDDLPDHGPLPPGLTRIDIAKSIIKTLKDGKAPKVFGFVNAKQLQAQPEDVEVLKLWTAAGFPLGSHTYSHMDLNKNTVAAFEQDVAANEAVLRTLMPAGDWHWFRYPYLNEGDTPEKKHAIEVYLKDHGYKIADVTLSFGDYAWNGPYARCAHENDTSSIDELKALYLKAASESIRAGQSSDYQHVMLLHIGAFETVMLPHLLELLKKGGYTLVPLQEAEKDASKHVFLPSQTTINLAKLDQFCH